MPLQDADVNFVMNDLRVNLPGSSDTGIKQALWGVVKEFLQDTNSWIEYQPVRVTAGVQEYNVSPRNGGQIVRLIGVRDGNFIPVPAAMPTLGKLVIARQVTVTSDTVSSGSPNAQNPWTVGLVKNIQLPATKDGFPVAPQFVLQVYSDTIVHGVLGKMMLQQGATYTNLQLGKYHLTEFRNGVGIARTDTWNQNLLGGQRWAFPQQFSTNSQRGYSTSAQWPQETF